MLPADFNKVLVDLIHIAEREVIGGRDKHNYVASKIYEILGEESFNQYEDLIHVMIETLVSIGNKTMHIQFRECSLFKSCLSCCASDGSVVVKANDTEPMQIVNIRVGK
jgi:hypothetical protein